MQSVNRIDPRLPVQAYKTYAISRPRSTHYRPASCAEAGCPAYQRGWMTLVDTSTAQGSFQADYIRKTSGRAFTEEARGPGTVAFTFEPGQRCFGSDNHQVPVEREPLYVVRGGDWRGNPSGERRQHARPEDWVEDFALHQGQLADRIERG